MNPDNSPIHHWNYRSNGSDNSVWMNTGSVVASTSTPNSSSSSSLKRRRNLSESDDCDAYSEDSKEQCSSTATTDSCQMLTRKRRRGIIEKKRRDRINQSLCELKRLVPSAYEKQGSAKLEKAEILQMTVDYLKVLYEKGGAATGGFNSQTSSYDHQKLAVEYQTIGFRECANEIARYLVTVEGLDLQDPLRLRLISHLQCYSAQREMASSSAAAMAAAAAATATSSSTTVTNPSPNNCWPYTSDSNEGKQRERRQSNESETNVGTEATSTASLVPPPPLPPPPPPTLRSSYALNSLEMIPKPLARVSDPPPAITTSAAILPHINMHDSAGNNYLDISASCTFTVNAQNVLSKIQQQQQQQQQPATITTTTNQQIHKNNQSHTGENSHSLIFAPNLTPLTPVSTGPYSQYFSYQHQQQQQQQQQHLNGSNSGGVPVGGSNYHYHHFPHQNFSTTTNSNTTTTSAAAAAQMKPYRPWGGPELAY